MAHVLRAATEVVTRPAATRARTAWLDAHGPPYEVVAADETQDARFVAKIGIDVVGSGPGEGPARHGPNELVPLGQAMDAGGVLPHSAAELLTGGDW